MLEEIFPPTRMAPRASNVTVPLAPERVLAFSAATLTPKAVAMAPGLGGPPAGKGAANPAIMSCFSVERGVVLPFGVVQTVQSVQISLIWQLICVLRRTASNRVNFCMSETRECASLSL